MNALHQYHLTFNKMKCKIPNVNMKDRYHLVSTVTKYILITDYLQLAGEVACLTRSVH